MPDSQSSVNAGSLLTGTAQGVLSDVVREHGGSQTGGRISGSISRFWQGFGGQVLRGERSATEVVAGFTGFADPMEGMFGGAGSIRDKAHARQLLREGFRPSSMLRRFPGQVGRQIKQLGQGTGLGMAFIGLDVGMRMKQGESFTGASLRAAGGSIGGAIVGAAVGAVAGSILPVGGNIVGAIAGATIGYAGGEATANVGIGAVQFMHDLGMRSRRMELGGRVSAGLNTRAAHTMRARALQQINRSGINMRSVLSREATINHISGGPPQLAR